MGCNDGKPGMACRQPINLGGIAVADVRAGIPSCHEQDGQASVLACTENGRESAIVGVAWIVGATALDYGAAQMRAGDDLLDLPLRQCQIVEIDAAHSPESSGVASNELDDGRVRHTAKALARLAPGDHPNCDARFVHLCDAGVERAGYIGRCGFKP
jgi:hypothetical protein